MFDSSLRHHILKSPLLSKAAGFFMPDSSSNVQVRSKAIIAGFTEFCCLLREQHGSVNYFTATFMDGEVRHLPLIGWDGLFCRPGSDWSVLMARVCEVTGKGPMTGNNVSHANNKTKRRFLPNLQYRRFWVETENRWIRLRISNAGLRLIDKNGIDSVLADLRARGQA